MRFHFFMILLFSGFSISAQYNIVWISAEDLSPRMAAYGDSTISTPNLDRLSREGITYTHAYTAAGVCAPSRNAIITGMYQISTGGHNMRTLGNTYPEQTGLPKEYNSVPPASTKLFPEYLRAKGYYTSNNSKTDYQFTAPVTVWDESSTKASHRNREGDQPFFAVYNFTTTHESQIWARAKNPMRADPKKVSLPPYYVDNDIARTDVARHYSNLSELDEQVGEILQQLEEDGLLDKTIVFFWGDHGDGLPFFKREIYKRGLHIPLVVRFPDKRAAGTYDAQLISGVDFAPTVLSLAGIAKPSHMQGRAFLGEHSSKEPRAYIFGARDRLDSEYDRVRSVLNKKYQYVRNYYPERPLYMDIAFRKQQSLMQNLLDLKEAGKLNEDQLFWFQEYKSPEEFYDLEKDPWQLNNLVNSPELAQEIAKFRNVMDEWLLEVNDRGAIPEKELVESMWKGAKEAPKTTMPQIKRKGKLVELSCTTEGASIGYRLQGEKKWMVYTGEKIVLPKSKKLEVVAHRIGYQPSMALF